MLEPLSTCEVYESKERFVEGMKKASSCACELARLRDDTAWMRIANLLDQIHNKGKLIQDVKPLNRQDVLFDLDRREQKARV